MRAARTALPDLQGPRHFLLVYIVEAHPGSILAVPADSGVEELQIIPPTATEPERLRNLHRFVRLLNLTIPAAIDDPENSVKRDDAAFPIRRYAVGVDGRIAFKSAPGPTGFKVPDLEAWLRGNAR